VKTRRPRQLSIFLICLSLQACGESPQTENKAKAAMDADAELLQDLRRAGPELERRLLERVSVQDGLFLIHEPVLSDLYVLPANSAWTLSCGLGGLSVVFGNSFRGESIKDETTSFGNDIEIYITEAGIDKEDCAVLGPRLGGRLKTMFQQAAQHQ
jgi:hypothetical protein